jgi:DNA repair protein RadD
MLMYEGFKLRSDQARLIQNIDQAVGSGHLHSVVQAPTAYGKTVVAAAMAYRGLRERERVLMTAPTLSLINQTVDRFMECGIPEDAIGVLQADHWRTDPSKPIQVASVQTLMRRHLTDFDLVLLDEIHIWFGKSYPKWLQEAWNRPPLSAYRQPHGQGAWVNTSVS